MRATVYILRSALKHYRPPERDERVFYYSPESGELYPRSASLEGFDEYVIVDSNVATGNTIRKTIEALGLQEKRVITRGNARTPVAEEFLDEVLPDPVPDRERAIIGLAGKSASMKSFISVGLGESHRIPVVKVGKVVSGLAGRYGEKLAEAEKDNPFIVGELLYDRIKGLRDRLVVVDGLKSTETAVFISYSTRRPIFLFYVEIPEEVRMKFGKLRNDPDDAYWSERDELFEERLRKLREKAYAVINPVEWKNMDVLCNVLKHYGYTTSMIAGVPNPFGSKVVFLELYRKNVEKLVARGAQLHAFLRCWEHDGYIKRLEERGIVIDEERKRAVILIATAFRMIDDILDENTIRDGKEAAWRMMGIMKALIHAVELSVTAWNICRNLGCGEEFMKMFRRVIRAVRYELDVEEGREKFSGFEDWLKAAERESAFREFLAVLAGLEERRAEFRLWGLKAQAKDDLLGEGKGGREPTERKLRRPLFREEWFMQLEQLEKCISYE
jgi:hypothetical protein